MKYIDSTCVYTYICLFGWEAIEPSFFSTDIFINIAFPWLFWVFNEANHLFVKLHIWNNISTKFALALVICVWNLLRQGIFDSLFSSARRWKMSRLKTIFKQLKLELIEWLAIGMPSTRMQQCEQIIAILIFIANTSIFCDPNSNQYFSGFALNDRAQVYTMYFAASRKTYWLLVHFCTAKFERIRLLNLICDRHYIELHWTCEFKLC